MSDGARAPADAGPAHVAPPQLRLCFVGDSFVQGIGDPQGAGWVGRVVRSALARGIDLTAFNLGIRRQTSVDIARRWEAECAVRLLPGTANHVLFSFGTNDTLIEHGARRVAPAVSTATVAHMLERARIAGYACAFVGPPPALDGADAVAALNDAMRDTCAAAEVGYLDLVAELGPREAWFEDVARTDRSHPGARGYELIARAVEAWPQWWFGPRTRAAAVLSGRARLP